jgi:uncharacterized membrane protein
MTYEDVISDIVRVVEAVGAAIMVGGALVVLTVFVFAAARHDRHSSYQELRRNLGRVIVLGLEVLIIADIIRTIVVDPTLESVGVLALIVLVRIVLSFSLEVEIEGVWPWNRWRTRQGPAPAGGPDAL